MNSQKPKPAPLPSNPPPPSFGLSGLGVPEDGQRMINELMLLYDNNVQGNSNAGNGTATKEKSHQQRDGQYQSDGYLRGQGMNIFEDNNISNNPSIFNPPDRFDQCKIMNLPFNPKPAENFQLMFSSPFNASSIDYTEAFPGVPRDNLPKQDVTIWY
ncbi:UNVERIFIED_CONTAM: hypothetical protein Sradi_6822000 [Sesamum radiatum]|uniref:Uncharacterized protein n=1 Tax=Sesamum radiatum TaxID=300843 RepID=A0AAW2JU48_SESRA